ncbi:drebrin-like [Rhynochetos jubatus]
MAAPGLERHRLALLAAKEDVGNPRAGTNWAVFAYEKHHDLKLLDSGAGGPDELAGKFSATSIMYGLCRVRDPGTGAHRIVLINWVGEKVPESQREACAGHLAPIRAFFREASAVLSARRAEEVTEGALSRALAQLAPPAATPPPLTRRVSPPEAQELVGTNYRKTNPALEIRRTQRDSFWAQAEREEQERKEQERRRAAAERRRWERERVEEEKREAAERELRCREKERLIEERRKEQARLEAEERRKEKARWEQQQREHEEAMRERGRRSESSEKAAEAAVLVSQRSQNPRDFFRQRERSGSTSGTPPPALGTGPGARRPFLRYQRSLTESAFIFRRPEPPSPGPLPPGAVPPPSPRRPQPALPTSPPGKGTPPWGPPGRETPGTPPPASPMGPASPSPPPTWGPPSPVGTGAGHPPRMGCPSVPPESTCEAEPLPPRSTPGLGSPSSSPPCPEEAVTLPPPSPPQDEEGAPPDTLPSPPAWGSPELLVELGGGVPSPQGGSPVPGLAPAPTFRAGTPPRSPSPPSKPQDLQPGECPGHPPCPRVGLMGPTPLPIGSVGHNGIGGHEGGGWPPPWEQDPPLGQGPDPGDTILEPRHRAKPGFALLLAHAPPRPPLPGGTSPPPTDEDVSPHAV